MTIASCGGTIKKAIPGTKKTHKVTSRTWFREIPTEEFETILYTTNGMKVQKRDFEEE